jgi:hypothetical protein
MMQIRMVPVIGAGSAPVPGIGHNGGPSLGAALAATDRGDTPPQGWPRITGPGDRPPRELMSRHTVLASGYSPRVRADVQLVQQSAGYNLAGAALRWDAAKVGVRWHSGGAIHGRTYRPEDAGKARAHFEELTAPLSRDEKVTAARVAFHCSKASADRDAESLASVEKYGRRGARGGLIGPDAKKAASLLRSIERHKSDHAEARQDLERLGADPAWPEDPAAMEAAEVCGVSS